MTKTKFKSDLAASIHASASALRRVGALDQAAMCGFDLSCIASPEAAKKAVTPMGTSPARRGLMRAR